MFTCRVNADLELRQLELLDAANLFALMNRNRDYLGSWLPGSEIFETLEAAQSFISLSLMRYEGNGAFDAGLWCNGRLCGVVSLHTINWEKRQSDIGYWLGGEFQGHGWMTAAVRTVVDHAFSQYGLKRLAIYCAVNNVKSRAIPERLGFKLERIRPQSEFTNGVCVDDAVYGMFDYKWRGELHPTPMHRKKDTLQ
jgi:ribosomal-protein-serine acetyltransferase